MADDTGTDLTDLVLTGPRLSLRPWQLSDAEIAFAALHDDPDVHRFTRIPLPYTREIAERWAGWEGNAGRADGSALGGPLVETASGTVVGSAALRIDGGTGDIGYTVYRGYRGKGYAAEATRMLLDWGFARGLIRIGLCCDVRNLASVKTALAAGLAFEGVTRGSTLLPNVAHGTSDIAHFARRAEDPSVPIPPRCGPLPAGGLSDGVVRLRMLEEADAAGHHELDDAETLRWSFTGQPFTETESRRRCVSAGLEWLVGHAAAMAIVDEATGAFAGVLTVRLAGPPGVGNVGYTVHPAHRGHGYTTRALRLLVSWAFEEAGLARLELGAKVDNVASQRAALRAGFEPDGVMAGRLRNPDGSYSDEARFAVLNPNVRRVRGGSSA
jgi:RimJ/RimL family protein N-acetyltransferase